jgi:UDP-2,4-diacetamido-2,4,6-trideoxy-beta-L-altropyranose hydrolase
MPAGTILIRADASIPMGTGHVMRCLAFAQHWHDEGGKAVFVMAQNTASVFERLKSEGFEVVRISNVPGSMEDAAELLEIAASRGSEWCVIDGYQFKADYQHRLKTSPRKLMMLDDNGYAGPYSTDLLVNQNIHAASEMYVHRAPYTRLLLGTGYAMLRREFTGRKVWKREIAPIGRKILVTMGGSDPENVTEQVLRALRSIRDEAMEVIAIIGGSNPHGDSLREAASGFSGKLALRTNVSNMPDLMAWADIAISAAGSTCWEMCLLGLPSIILPIAENQLATSIRLAELGVAETVRPGLATFMEELRGAIERTATSQEMRLAMSEAGRNLVDGDGYRRVAQAIREMSLDGGTHVRFA